jgi:hypothetical protein
VRELKFFSSKAHAHLIHSLCLTHSQMTKNTKKKFIPISFISHSQMTENSASGPWPLRHTTSRARRMLPPLEIFTSSRWRRGLALHQSNRICYNLNTEIHLLNLFIFCCFIRKVRDNERTRYDYLRIIICSPFLNFQESLGDPI